MKFVLFGSARTKVLFEANVSQFVQPLPTRPANCLCVSAIALRTAWSGIQAGSAPSSSSSWSSSSSAGSCGGSAGTAAGHGAAIDQTVAPLQCQYRGYRRTQDTVQNIWLSSSYTHKRQHTTVHTSGCVLPCSRKQSSLRREGTQSGPRSLRQHTDKSHNHVKTKDNEHKATEEFERRTEVHEAARNVDADVLAVGRRSNAVEGEAISSMEEVKDVAT